MLPRKILKISVLTNDFSCIPSLYYYNTILVDDLWHKLCNFFSKYLVSTYFSQSTLLTCFPAVMGGFKVLDRRGEEIGYGEKQTTRISSLIFLSFVKNLAVTSYRNKAYLLFYEKFQKDKKTDIAD